MPGWTWFSIVVQVIYGNSLLTFYAANDAYTGLSAPVPAKSEVTTLTGYYVDPPAAPTLMIYFGCRRNTKLVCYRALSGYFYSFKVWGSQALTPINLGFEITTSCGVAGCGVCHTDNLCFSQRNMLIY